MKQSTRMTAFSFAAATISFPAALLATHTILIACSSTNLQTFADSLKPADMFSNRQPATLGTCYGVYYQEIQFKEFSTNRWFVAIAHLKSTALSAIKLDGLGIRQGLVRDAKIHTLPFPVITQTSCDNLAALTAPNANATAHNIIVRFQEDVANMVKAGNVQNSGLIFWPDGSFFELAR